MKEYLKTQKLLPFLHQQRLDCILLKFTVSQRDINFLSCEQHINFTYSEKELIIQGHLTLSPDISGSL